MNEKNNTKISSLKQKIIIVVVAIIILLSSSIVIFIKYFSKKDTIKNNNYDYFISALANPNISDGSFNKPFPTIESAIQYIKQLSVAGAISSDKIFNIAIRGGNYNNAKIENYQLENKINFTNYNDEQVNFTFMNKLDNSAFKLVNDTDLVPLKESARNHIYKLDISGYNFTKEQIGNIYPKGHYINDLTDTNYTRNRIAQCNLYVNDTLQNLARYPNAGPTLLIENVLTNSKITKKGNGATITVDETTANRINSWRNLDNVWMYGYFAKDWADSSTSISKFEYTSKSLTTTFGHNYGFVKDGNFYFENVIEELDADNEWFLDDENKTLCLYSSTPLNNKVIELNVGNKVILSVSNSKNIKLSGVTLSGSRACGIDISNSNNIVIEHCEVKNLSNDAINITDSTNVMINNNEIFSIGSRGIILSPKTDIFEFQNNIISNNNIHDFGQIKRTYSAGIDISGIGNIINNNKLYNAPHQAIYLFGNCNLIENNNIYNVCTDSGDCGAIYAGRSFSNYGNIIQHNYIHNIQYKYFNSTTTRGYKPNGIYLDDFVSGQTIVNNIIANVGGQHSNADGSNTELGYEIFANGGRDNIIENNILLGARLSYRSTAKDGYDNGNTYFTDIVNGTFFKSVKTAKALNTKWGNVFARVNKLSSDSSDASSPNFAVNPVSSIKSNIVVYNFINRVPIILSSKLNGFSTKENNISIRMNETQLNFNEGLNISKTDDISYVKNYSTLIFNKYKFLHTFEVINNTIVLSDRNRELEYT